MTRYGFGYDHEAERAAAAQHVEGLLERHEKRGQRIQAALIEFLSAVAREGGEVAAVEVDDHTMRAIVARHAFTGGIIKPVTFYGPAGPVVLRRSQR